MEDKKQESEEWKNELMEEIWKRRMETVIIQRWTMMAELCWNFRTIY